MQNWNDLYIAAAGAAAALTGLIFVGISINLKEILSNSLLPIRASVSLMLLMSILVFSIVLLVPHETLTLTGYLITILGFILWMIVTRADLKIFRQTPKQYKVQFLFNLILDQVAIIPYVIGGLSILFVGEAGLYWLVPAFIFSFIKSVFEAWILLVEILR